MSVATGTRHLSWERAVVEADGESQRLCNGEYAEERVLLTNVREHAAALCERDLRVAVEGDGAAGRSGLARGWAAGRERECGEREREHAEGRRIRRCEREHHRKFARKVRRR